MRKAFTPLGAATLHPPQPKNPPLQRRQNFAVGAIHLLFYWNEVSFVSVLLGILATCAVALLMLLISSLQVAELDLAARRILAFSQSLLKPLRPFFNHPAEAWAAP